MDKNLIKKEFKENFNDLRKIINSWNLISGSPKNEFDSLNHQLLSHLYKEIDIKKIQEILKSELTSYYGLYISKFDSERLAKEVFDWWYY